MVRLAGKLQKAPKFMSGTTFYFCHVTNKRDAMSETQYGGIVKSDTIQFVVRKYLLYDTVKARKAIGYGER